MKRNTLKGFSLLEMVLIISIFAIIAFVAFPNIIINKEKTDIFKLKSDVLSIRLGLVDKFYTNTISNTTNSISLDNARINTSGDDLFKNIINYNIISTSLENLKINTWVKTDNNKYVFVLNGDTLKFIYDKNKMTFNCDVSNKYCREINK